MKPQSTIGPNMDSRLFGILRTCWNSRARRAYLDLGGLSGLHVLAGLARSRADRGIENGALPLDPPRGQVLAGPAVSDSPFEEFLAIVQRDLAADSVRVVDADEEPPADERSLRCDLPDGRRLVATFAEPPDDVEARRRRLDMLVAAFTDTLVDDGRSRSVRPPPARSLQEELAALAQRSGALEVVVIDAFSPVVWGSAGELDDHAGRVAEIMAELRTPTPPPVGVGGVPPARPALHAVDADDLAAAARYGLASAQGLRINPDAQRLVPRAVCARHHLLPIAHNGAKLVVAMADPSDAGAVHDLVLLTGLQIEPAYAGESMAAFFRHLGDEDDARTYEDVMAAIPAETRAAREPIARRARDEWARAMLTRRAIAEVRELPEADGLHKGALLRSTVAAGDFGYVARSFASIYIVILVFGGPFDELLTKRALAHALPTIERLVAALPPLDPPPRMGGVAALRAPRRRR
jgi:hypothetical protein